MTRTATANTHQPRAARYAQCPPGSRWQRDGDPRVWVVIERRPFGRLMLQVEGRARFGDRYQRELLASYRRLPDNAKEC